VSPLKPTSFRERCFVQKHGTFLLRNVKSKMKAVERLANRREVTSSPAAADAVNKTSEFSSVLWVLSR